MNSVIKTIGVSGPDLRSLPVVVLVAALMIVAMAAFAESPREKLTGRGLEFTVEDFVRGAAAKGEIETVKLFLAAGMDVNKKMPYLSTRGKRRGFGGQTALHAAASGGHAKLVAYLIEKGAAYDPTGNHNETPLLVAAIAGHAKVIGLLAAKGADVDRKDTYLQTPLILSVKAGNVDAVKILLANGAKVNEIDFNRAAALDYAGNADNAEIIQLLKGSGGKKAHELR
ncbi:MAG: ankyrin repeat domain-containing protein [Rhodospirillaceae bacterium]|jgi:uncharacterized protein|nr:ankyrin repeat domain-containing protein [Rhodospirillaceae bacterium]MBT5454960.1 ankyrin repeat domain-containing protein [Rhodospirillaceae bacterium]MBT5896632.1 ankyrin repeat domain-containing protein [Rhodospirillaceae bacterium]